jgi:hypothetical protein
MGTGRSLGEQLMKPEDDDLLDDRRQPIDWTAVEFGQESDSALAKRLGVSRQRVAQKRIEHGVAVYQAQAKAAVALVPDAMGVVRSGLELSPAAALLALLPQSPEELGLGPDGAARYLRMTSPRALFDLADEVIELLPETSRIRSRLLVGYGAAGGIASMRAAPLVRLAMASQRRRRPAMEAALPGPAWRLEMARRVQAITWEGALGIRSTPGQALREACLLAAQIPRTYKREADGAELPIYGAEKPIAEALGLSPNAWDKLAHKPLAIGAVLQVCVDHGWTLWYAPGRAAEERWIEGSALPLAPEVARG